MNQRQELFCQGLFSGKTATQAYIDAGYAPKKASCCAVRLQRNASVVARMKELNDMVVSDKVVTVKECLERLSEIIRARYPDFVECGADGAWINIGPETPNAGAVAEIHSRTEYDEKTAKGMVYTSVKLHDPVKAIAEYLKATGAYPAAKVDVTSKGEQIKPATYPVGNGNLGNVLRGLVDIGAVKVVAN